MPPSRQTLALRRQDVARLQAIAGELVRVTRVERGYLITLPAGVALFGPVRYEVAAAFLVGFTRGLSGRL